MYTLFIVVSFDSLCYRAESTSSLLRLERKTIGEPTPLQQPSSTSTETKERQGQAIPTRRVG